ncbi:hypothetical protein F383_36373 [Gossypium arboreum]|nr:hypothetical protein F383_36373 [Gossypium arboreum]
MCGIDMR